MLDLYKKQTRFTLYVKKVAEVENWSVISAPKCLQTHRHTHCKINTFVGSTQNPQNDYGCAVRQS